MHRNRSARCAAPALALFCHAGLAQTLTTDTTWSAHSSVGLTENVIVNEGVTLTIEEGVDVWVDRLGGASANITVYGNLVVNGTETDPVLLGSAPNPDAFFNGVRFDGVSSGSISHAEMRIARASAIYVEQDFLNTDPTPREFTFDHVTITENADFGYQAGNPVVLIVLNPVGPQSVSISGCEIHGIVPDNALTHPDGNHGDVGDPGKDGTVLNRDGGRGDDGDSGDNGVNGDDGLETIGIRVFGGNASDPNDLVTIHNTSIYTLRGQHAGNGSNAGVGGDGGDGGKGKNVTAGNGGKGGRGGNGGNGGDGGHGGSGGDAVAIRLESPPDCVITQCLMYDLRNGNPGNGGIGGYGQSAGDGGNGGNSNTIAGDGGNGGNGGHSGNGGSAGNGGIDGSTRGIEIINAARDVSMVNNTVMLDPDVSQGLRGIEGLNGPFPGQGGSKGIALGTGSNGSNGSDGSLGSNGTQGSHGSFGTAFGVQVSNDTASPPQTLIANNIFFFSGNPNKPSSGAESNGTSDVLFHFNSVYGFATPIGGTGTLWPSSTIVSDPLLVNHRPSAGSPAIDSGNNTHANNAGLVFDLDGNPRFQDDLATPDSGAGNFTIVDRGAFEFEGFVCQVDMNADNVVDNGDIGLFIDLFLAGVAAGEINAADINGDGFLDNGDIFAFISAFIAGC